MPAAKPAATRNEDAQLYRNTNFGFRYQIPYGWVERTKEMTQGNEAAKADPAGCAFDESFSHAVIFNENASDDV